MSLSGVVDPKTLLDIRDLVLKDHMAISYDGWLRLVDRLIVESAIDVRNIRDSWRAGRFSEAVHYTLQVWQSLGGGRADLLDELRRCSLMKLAEQIGELVGLPSNSQRVWFGVGDKVYNFTGRIPELEELHQKLLASRSEPSDISFVSVTGLGGIGKSALARAYAHEHRYRTHYGCNVIWMEGQNPETIRKSLIKLATTKLGLTAEAAAGCTNEELARKAYGRFKRVKSLFIFDDVQELGHIEPVLYRTEDANDERPHILITSRRRGLSRPSANELQLQALNLVDAMHLLRGQLAEAKERVLDLAKVMNGLPLALQQAIEYIAQEYGPEPDDEAIELYLEELAENGEGILSDPKFQRRVDDYTETTFTTWDSTFGEMAQAKADHEPVIKLLSYLNPDLISMEFLSLIHPSRKEMRRKIRSLERYSMVCRTGNYFSIHRLVQRVIRLKLGTEEEEGTLLSIASRLQVALATQERTNVCIECKLHGRYMASELNVTHPEFQDNIAGHLVYLVKDEDQHVVDCVLQHVFGEGHQQAVVDLKTAESHHYEGQYSEASSKLEAILTGSDFNFSLDMENILRFTIGKKVLVNE